jgi:hypothetical protein
MSLTATLPATAPASGWCVDVLNLNSTALVISRGGGSFTVNGVAANPPSVPQFQSVEIWSDSTNYFANTNLPLPATFAVGTTSAPSGVIAPGSAPSSPPMGSFWETGLTTQFGDPVQTGGGSSTASQIVLQCCGMGNTVIGVVYPNDTLTGTTSGDLVRLKWTGSANTVINFSSADVGNNVVPLGVCFAPNPNPNGYTCGNTGNAAIATWGTVPLNFDNTANSGDLIGISSSTAGNGTDLGYAAPLPGSQTYLGTVFGSTGTPMINLNIQPAGPPAAMAVQSFTGTVAGGIMSIYGGGTGAGTCMSTVTVALGAPNQANGIQATAEAVMSSGSISYIRMTNAGSGYTSAPTVTIGNTTGCGTTSGWSAAVAGQVVNLHIVSRGGTCSGTPGFSFSSGLGPSTAPTATGTFSGATLATVSLTTGGSGYITAPSVTVSGCTTAPTVVAEVASDSICASPTLGVSGTDSAVGIGYDNASGSSYSFCGNTTAATVQYPFALTQPVPSGLLGQGRQLNARAVVVATSSASPPTLSLKVRWGGINGTSLFSTASTALSASLSAAPGLVDCAVVGTAAVSASNDPAYTSCNAALPGWTPAVNISGLTQPATPPTNAAKTLGLAFVWGTATAGNVVQLVSFQVSSAR